MLDRLFSKHVKSISLEYPTEQQLIVDYRPLATMIYIPIIIVISALFFAIYLFYSLHGTILGKLGISLVAFLMGLSLGVPVFLLVPWQILCIFDLEQNQLIINRKILNNQNVKKYTLKDIRVARIVKSRKSLGSYDADSKDEPTVVEQYEIILYGELGTQIKLFGDQAHSLSSKRQDYERIIRHIKSFLDI